ncbi:MAG: hypothetical protein R2705_24000 [Ilumatobacteraceae bacterium]
MIEPQSNYIEHPELVARLQQWASVVDPERLLAGVDRVLGPCRDPGRRSRRGLGQAQRTLAAEL